MGLAAKKYVFGVSDKRDSNQSNQLQRLAIKLKIRLNKQITKALIRQRTCEGWSTPLLFANTEDRFSRFEAQITAHFVE